VRQVSTAPPDLPLLLMALSLSGRRRAPEETTTTL